jgi:uncharacterized protein (TIGR03032 family)
MATEPNPQPPPTLGVETSPGFTEFLAAHDIALAFTTYQSSRLFLVGRQTDGRVSLTERTFPRAMGLWSDGQTMWMGTLYQLWRLENVLGPGERYQDHDRMYAPRLGHVTGAINVHDVAVGGSGEPVFVATQFSCLAAPSATHNFRPLWRPPFVSALLPEDRCHLNGLALRDGAPAYVTALAETDTAQGWRDGPRDRGCVIDVAANEVVLRGLAVPHSPRWIDGFLWFLESGSGHVCRADPATGGVERIAFCPGYLRGFAPVGRFAVVGLSKPRRPRAFAELTLESSLARRGLRERCGLAVVDLERGSIVHSLWLDGFVAEIYDVVILPGVVRPMALGFMTEQIQLVITMEGMPSPLQAPIPRRDIPGEGPP